MQANKLIWMSCCLWCLVACGQKTLLPSEYIQWVTNPEHGLVQSKNIHPLKVELLYKPIDYIIANEQRTNAIPPDLHQERQAALEGMQYYTLKLGIEGGQQDVTNYGVTDLAEQQERLAYLSFALQRDIKLIEAGDTLPCQLFHFERSYDLTPYRTFVLAFEQREASRAAEKTVVVELPYFKTGPIKLNYQESDLASIPSLKL